MEIFLLRNTRPPRDGCGESGAGIICYVSSIGFQLYISQESVTEGGGTGDFLEERLNLIDTYISTEIHPDFFQSPSKIPHTATVNCISLSARIYKK